MRVQRIKAAHFLGELGGVEWGGNSVEGGSGGREGEAIIISRSQDHPEDQRRC